MKTWLAVWLVSTTLPLTWMAAKHTGVLRSPDVEQRLAATGQWRTIHVLLADCGCSRRVADALRAVSLVETADEIWWIGETSPDQVFPFPVRRFDGQRLRQTAGLTGGPALLIVDPAGLIRYGGGYPEADTAGRKLAASVKQGRAAAYRKIRGCAAKMAKAEEN